MQTSLAGERYADTDGEAHAKGITILRATFPVRGEVWRVTLTNSRDGEEFREAGFGRLGVPDLLKSIVYQQRTTTILVPAIGWFGTDISFFGTPGTYWFRWHIDFRDEDKPRTVPDQRDKNTPPVVIDQVLEVGPALQSDLNFIEGLSDPDLIRHMFGNDFFERQTGNAIEHFADPEVRAVMVIGHLLRVTRERESKQAVAWYGPHGDLHKAAATLLSLAKDIPESSYAPYAAYYAGCCYASIASNRITKSIRAGKRDQESFREAQTRLLIPLVKRDADATTAAEAFKLASDYGDDYLKPRALYQQSLFSASVGAFDDAEKLLTEALQVAPGEGTIQEWTDKAREGADRLRAELEKGEERVSTTEEPGESE